MKISRALAEFIIAISAVILLLASSTFSLIIQSMAIDEEIYILSDIWSAPREQRFPANLHMKSILTLPSQCNTKLRFTNFMYFAQNIVPRIVVLRSGIYMYSFIFKMLASIYFFTKEKRTENSLPQKNLQSIKLNKLESLKSNSTFFWSSGYSRENWKAGGFFFARYKYKEYLQCW